MNEIVWYEVKAKRDPAYGDQSLCLDCKTIEQVKTLVDTLEFNHYVLNSVLKIENIQIPLKRG